MNIFIKRSMQLAVALVFIGASVVPACAQNKKGIIKGAKAALGKKPPMTGTAPVVRPPVTPRVPPAVANMTYVKVPHLSTAGNLALKVERVIVSKNKIPNFNVAVSPETVFTAATPKPSFWSQQQILERIQKIDISSIINKQMHRTPSVDHPYGEVWKTYPHIKINFGEWVTPNTPDFIPFRNTAYGYKGKMDVLKEPFMFAAIKKTDEFFFIKRKDGKIYIKKEALIQGHSYAEILDRLARNIHSVYLGRALRDFSDFVDLRQRQIKESLLLMDYPENAQIAEGAFQTDPTTQRTAEEIQSLVENLAPENPLRQAIEGTLQENGYIAPAE